MKKKEIDGFFPNNKKYNDNYVVNNFFTCFNFLLFIF